MSDKNCIAGKEVKNIIKMMKISLLSIYTGMYIIFIFLLFTMPSRTAANEYLKCFSSIFIGNALSKITRIKTGIVIQNA